MSDISDEKIWRSAQKRVNFRKHLWVYIIVNVALIILWALSRKPDDNNYWFLYPMCGWGIGVALHYWNAFHNDDTSIEKEYKRLKKQRDIENGDKLPPDQPGI